MARAGGPFLPVNFPAPSCAGPYSALASVLCAVTAVSCTYIKFLDRAVQALPCQLRFTSVAAGVLVLVTVQPDCKVCLSCWW